MVVLDRFRVAQGEFDHRVRGKRCHRIVGVLLLGGRGVALHPIALNAWRPHEAGSFWFWYVEAFAKFSRKPNCGRRIRESHLSVGRVRPKHPTALYTELAGEM